LKQEPTENTENSCFNTFPLYAYVYSILRSIVEKEEDIRELQHHFNAISTLFQHGFLKSLESHTGIREMC
jgi:hypothetical protein